MTRPPTRSRSRARAARPHRAVGFDQQNGINAGDAGIYKNDINMHTVLDAASNGSVIFAAMPDGNVMLYDATADTFTVSRKDVSTLSGTFSASNLGLYVVGNQLLNDSLVPITSFDASTSTTAGFAFVDGLGLRTAAATGAGKIGGSIQRVALPTGNGVLATRMVEPGLTGVSGSELIRTLAPLSNRN